MIGGSYNGTSGVISGGQKSVTGQPVIPNWYTPLRGIGEIFYEQTC